MNHTALNSTTSAAGKEGDWGRWAENEGEGGLKKKVAISIQSQAVDGNARVHNGNNFYMTSQPSTFDRRDADILKWLAPRVSFHQTHDGIQEQARIAHYADSVRNDNYPGKWLIESDKFQEWRSGSLLKLWCFGMPGAGKSVLASIVIAHLLELQEQLKRSRDSARVAYLYLSYKEEYTLQELLGSVIKQLVSIDDVVPECVVKVWRKRGQGADAPTIEDFSAMLRNLVQERRALLVVDALDECKPDYRLRLMSLLQPESSNVSLLVTSRLLDEFDEVSSDFEKIEITANSTDLDLFIDHEFRSHPRLKKFLKMDPTLQEAVKNSIKRACRGMFLVAFLQMQSIEAERTLGEIRGALDSLPRKINDMYEHTMARIYGMKEADRKLAVRTLSWIVCARRPLATKELQHALSVVPGNFELDLDMIYPEDNIRDVCGGLVTITDGLVSLVHNTAQGYFRGRFSGFHATIAQTCISYLSLGVLEQPDDDTDAARSPQELHRYFEAHSASTDNRLSFEEKMDRFPFAGYAATSLGNHLRMLDDAPTVPSIAQSLVELLQSRPKRGFLLQMLHASYYPRPYLFRDMEEEQEFGSDALRHDIMECPSDSDLKTTSTDTRRPAPGREVNAIHLAAFLGWPPAVLRILETAEAPFDINVLDTVSRTPLWIAVIQGNWDVVDVILSYGGSIDFLDKAGHNILRRLARGDQVDIIKHLIAANLNPAPAKLLQSENPTEGVAEEPRALPGRGEELAASEAQSSTPSNHLTTYLQLMLAAGLGDIGTIQKLLAGGEATFSADTTMFYITAFFLAVEANHLAAVKKMLDSGVDVDTRGLGRETALHIAAARNYVEVVELLFARNAALNLRDEWGEAPYTANADKEHKNARWGNLQLLRTAGANPNDKTRYGFTRLRLAAGGGDIENVKFLLQSGVNPSITTGFDLAPLHWAAFAGHADCVRELLKWGVDPNTMGYGSKTPLDMARKMGQTHVVKILLDAGAKTGQEMLEKRAKDGGEDGDGDGDGGGGEDGEDNEDEWEFVWRAETDPEVSPEAKKRVLSFLGLVDTELDDRGAGWAKEPHSSGRAEEGSARGWDREHDTESMGGDMRTEGAER